MQSDSLWWCLTQKEPERIDHRDTRQRADQSAQTLSIRGTEQNLSPPPENHGDANAERSYRLEHKKYVVECLTLGGLVAYVAINLFILCAMRKSNQINHEALVNIQRAFVFPGPIDISRSIDHGSVTGYRIDMTWENSGSTPARGATLLPMQFVPDKSLPDDYPFAQDTTLDKEPIPIAPRGKQKAYIADISVADFSDVVSGKKFFYVWGSIWYSDVFSADPVHLTEYCAEFSRLTSGDVNNFSIPITAEWQHCMTHNCSDKDCPDYDDQIAQYAKAVAVTPTPAPSPSK